MLWAGFNLPPDVAIGTLLKSAHPLSKSSSHWSVFQAAKAAKTGRSQLLRIRAPSHVGFSQIAQPLFLASCSERRFSIFVPQKLTNAAENRVKISFLLGMLVPILEHATKQKSQYLIYRAYEQRSAQKHRHLHLFQGNYRWRLQRRDSSPKRLYLPKLTSGALRPTLLHSTHP